jgi:hypothetical protein
MPTIVSRCANYAAADKFANGHPVTTTVTAVSREEADAKQRTVPPAAILYSN